MVKPDAGKSFDAAQDEAGRDPGYRDANYTSEGDGASAPNFYSPSSHRKEPKAKKQARGMPAAAIVALCLVCALVGGGFGGVIAGSLGGNDAQPQATLNQQEAPPPQALAFPTPTTVK